jgi:alpha-beta hydrolase superfamily lysophospholipase
LSRDPAEVDKYIADPLCGDDIPLTLGYVRGMVSAFGAATDSDDPVRKDLPVLFITGEMDPVSQNAASVRELEQRWRDYGVADLTALYYPEARHELLNEINRDEVQADLLAWMERVAQG